jgi:hypothetical protein
MKTESDWSSPASHGQWALSATLLPRFSATNSQRPCKRGESCPLIRNLLMGHTAAGERTEGHGLGMTAVYTHLRPETVREQLFAALSRRPALFIVRRKLEIISMVDAEPVNAE